MSTLSKLLVCTALFLAVANSTLAQAVEDFTLDPRAAKVHSLSDNRSKDWRFTFMAYLWLPGFTGDGKAGDQSSDIESSPVDILENFNYGFLGEAELSCGPFSLVANGMFIGLEFDDVGPRDQGTANLDGFILDVAACFTIADWKMGKDSRLLLQPLGGFRYYDLNITLDPERLGDVEVGVGLWDPVVGARLIAECGPHWVFKFRGDVGGFGVGTELSWLADASVSYWFNRNFFLAFGYKALGLDLDDDTGPDRAAVDGILHGPYLGIGFGL